MIKIKNLEEILFDPILSSEQIAEIESWDFRQFDFHSPIDDIGNLQNIIEENIDIEFKNVSGLPRYSISEDLISSIQSKIKSELIEEGTIGDLIYESLQKHALIDNVDSYYEESFGWRIDIG